ncbi:MAG: hypothetical protein ABWK05_02000 [Pyrobaculum sp.]
MKRKLVVIIAMAVLLSVALLAVANSGNGDVAKKYYEESYFTYGSHTAFLGSPDYTPQKIDVGDTAPAKPAGVPQDVEKNVVERARVRGRILGTYVYNATHYVTLVEKEPLDVVAIVWNSQAAAVRQLKFEKVVEKAYNKTVLRDGKYSYVVGRRYVGYKEVSGVLPFSVVTFYDENWGQWNTPLGYFKVAAAGWFIIIYGAAVYVTDASYYVITDPMLRLCTFTSSTSGDGTPQASVRAYGKAVTVPCAPIAPFGTVFDVTVTIGYSAWLIGFFPPAVGNKWFTSSCEC